MSTYMGMHATPSTPLPAVSTQWAGTYRPTPAHGTRTHRPAPAARPWLKALQFAGAQQRLAQDWIGYYYGLSWTSAYRCGRKNHTENRCAPPSLAKHTALAFSMHPPPAPSANTSQSKTRHSIAPTEAPLVVYPPFQAPPPFPGLIAPLSLCPASPSPLPDLPLPPAARLLQPSRELSSGPPRACTSGLPCHKMAAVRVGAGWTAGAAACLASWRALARIAIVVCENPIQRRPRARGCGIRRPPMQRSARSEAATLAQPHSSPERGAAAAGSESGDGDADLCSQKNGMCNLPLPRRSWTAAYLGCLSWRRPALRSPPQCPPRAAAACHRAPRAAALAARLTHSPPPRSSRRQGRVACAAAPAALASTPRPCPTGAEPRRSATQRGCLPTSACWTR